MGWGRGEGVVEWLAGFVGSGRLRWFRLRGLGTLKAGSRLELGLPVHVDTSDLGVVFTATEVRALSWASRAMSMGNQALIVAFVLHQQTTISLKTCFPSIVDQQ